ncbi:tumor necrosis factor ligand superfamily member 6-like [Microcaecilia unicolor]|uniref:Tumor necrosis factor ligand superfamily member 6-like n=1 Tax=Microcaecilia unicolor TaxID=1415580 RepID=A0A6P7X4P1_9AMPH|nr:tumor necrosis factor ligand superfamily member 6-like [Microcaecilia unicolor]
MCSNETEGMGDSLQKVRDCHCCIPMEVISLPPRCPSSPETPQKLTPTKHPWLLYVLLLWCATLTLSFLGMAGYVITGNRAQQQTSHSIRQETSSNQAELAASDTQMEETLQWDMDNSATLYNFRYSQGSIVIPSVGYYYIYSQVTFNNLESENIEQHLLQKTPHYPHPISLLESSITTGCHAHTLSLGGAFCFDKGTEIYVNVSYPNNVNTEHTRTFFGAFQLANTPSCRKKEPEDVTQAGVA